jgi:large subunit ribosomal protein L9
MELILKQDVQNLGFKDDVVNVKNGYGRNFLIPQGFASLATPSAKKVLAENLKQRAHKEAKVVSDAQALAEKLKALEIKLTAKAGGEKLFGSISNIDIAAALEAAGHNVDRKFITSGLVKRTGKYTASVRLHRDVVVELPYEIVAEI